MAPQSITSRLRRVTNISIPPAIAIPFSLSLPLWISIYSTISYYNDYVRSQGWRMQDSTSPEIFDFIVVGGGSAGAVAANRLSEKYSVLLLEMGGNPNPVSYLPYPSHLLQRCHGTDLMYSTVPQNSSCFSLNDNVSYWPRGTGLGGSSNLNSMIYQRGNPNDYDNWARITGNSEWTYDNVLPIFKKLEDYHGAFPSDYHGTGGPLHVEKLRQPYMERYFLEAAREKGYRIGDPSARQTECFAPMDVTMKNGMRWSTYPAYLRPILDRKTLTIYRYAQATKIHLDENRHAYGVTFYRHGRYGFVKSRKEIIVSAGSIDTAKLLMLSGIGVQNELQALGIESRVNLPVGKNLQDHIYGLIGPIIVDKDESLVLDTDTNARALWNFTRHRTGPIATISISAVGFVTTSVRNDKNWPEIQYYMNGAGVSTGAAETLNRISNIKRAEFDKYIKPFYGKHANLALVTLVRPKSFGEVTLAGDDPFLKPIIQPNYLTHPDDIKALVEGTKIIVDMYENTKVYKDVNARLIPYALPGCESWVFKSDEYWECVNRHMTFTIYHPVGTCAMGKGLEDPRAVVDSELRVLKTTGLRVVDASIMPVIVNANTNVPSILIGEMGSKFILRHWENAAQFV